MKQSAPVLTHFKMSETNTPDIAESGGEYFFPPKTQVEREALAEALAELHPPTPLEVPILLVEGQRALVALSAHAALIPSGQRKYDFELKVKKGVCELHNLRNNSSVTVVDELNHVAVHIASVLSTDPVRVFHHPDQTVRAIECSRGVAGQWVFSGSVTGGQQGSCRASALTFDGLPSVGHNHFVLRFVPPSEEGARSGFALWGFSEFGDMYIQVSQSTD